MRWQCVACENERNAGKMPRWCDCGAERSFVLADGEAETAEQPRARRATEAIGEIGRLRQTGDRELDELLGGGILEGSAVLVHGLRGSGKTRLVTRWASLGGACLFVHAELASPVAGAILSSTGANLRGVWLFPVLDGWQAEARRVRARAVVLDSISLAKDPAAALVAAREWAQERAGVVWCVSHENAAGRAKGGTKAPHLADYEIRIEPCAPGSGVSRVSLKKSRLGPSGAVLVPLVPGSSGGTESKPRRGRKSRRTTAPAP